MAQQQQPLGDYQSSIARKTTSGSTYHIVETSYDPGSFFVSEQDDADDRSSTPTTATTATITTPKRPNAQCRDYKPTALRWWFHLLLIACFITLIGLTEYAIRSLTAIVDGSDVFADLIESRDIGEEASQYPGRVNIVQQIPHQSETGSYERTATGVSLFPRENANDTTDSTTTSDSATSTTDSTTTTTTDSTTSVNAWLLATATTANEGAASPDAYLNVGIITDVLGGDEPSSTVDTTTTLVSGESGGTSETLTADSSAYLQTGFSIILTTIIPTPILTTILPTPTTTTDGYVNIGSSTSTSTGIESMTTTDGYVNIGSSTSTIIETQTTTSDNYLSLGTTTATTTDPSSTPIGVSAAEIETSTSDGYVNIGKTSFTVTTILGTQALISQTTPQEELSGTSSLVTVETGSDSTGAYLEVGETSANVKEETVSATASLSAYLKTGASVASSTPTPSVTVVIVQQTTTGPSSTITTERTTTDDAGQVSVETVQSTVEGQTSVVEASVTISNTGGASQQDTTVIQQTVVVSGVVTTTEQTSTNTDGQVTVNTYQTTLPDKTTVVQSTLSVQSGQVLVTRPSVIESTVGGTTETAETTFTDAQGQVSSVSYTTVIGGTATSSTVAVVMATSIPQGATLATYEAVVATTVGGVTAIAETTFTDAQGHVTSMPYTTVIGGTLTSKTVDVVTAISVPQGDTLVTYEAVVATTVGGRTEVLETTYTDAQGHTSSSSYTTVIGGTRTSATVWTVAATSAPAGETLITVGRIIPITTGGTTEVLATTSTDAQGHAHTSSYTTVVGGTPTSTTLWTVVATALTALATGNPSSPGGNEDGSGGITATTVTVIGVSWKQYILGTFVPTIIAVLVAFPIKLISINARLMQPFHALATADEMHGSPPEASVFLRFYSWSGSLSFPRALRLRQPIIAISDVLVLGAGLLAPLAAEAISVHVADSCQVSCYGSLSVSPLPSRVLEGLMAVMTALLLTLIILLSVMRWKTGVSHNPWSIAGIASLCLDPGMREVMRGIPRGVGGPVDDSVILKALEGRRYAIGSFWTSPDPETSSRGYGITVAGNTEAGKQLLGETARDQTVGESFPLTKKTTQPFMLLTWWGRCIMLLVFSCVFIILVYYENTSGNTGFEKFMDSQSLSVRFFITAVGVFLGYCMETVFRCKYSDILHPSIHPSIHLYILGSPPD